MVFVAVDVERGRLLFEIQDRLTLSLRNYVIKLLLLFALSRSRPRLVSKQPSMSFTKAFSPAIREVRVLLSQTGAASAGTRCVFIEVAQTRAERARHTRQFILSKYPVIKQHNPDLPFMIREATGTPARAFARFGSFNCPSLELE